MDGDAVAPNDRRTPGTGTITWTWVAAVSGVAGHVLFLWRTSTDDSEDPYTLASYWPLIPIAGVGVAAVVLGVLSVIKSGGSTRRIIITAVGLVVGVAVTYLAGWGLWVFGVDQPFID